MTTRDFKREYPTIRHIQARAGCPDIQWLSQLRPPSERVANFGCNVGMETLALVAALDATEAVGIDIDPEVIRQARGSLEHVRTAARVALVGKLHRVRGQESWWDRHVPPFAKGLLFDEIPDQLRPPVRAVTVDFIVADVAGGRTQLRPSYYDLAYCESVLYHIWADHGAQAARRAVHEMARVVRPGGWVAAVEPASWEGTFLDFAESLESAGLERIAPVQGMAATWPPNLTVYAYIKPAGYGS